MKNCLLCGLVLGLGLLLQGSVMAKGPFRGYGSQSRSLQGDGWAQAHAANRPWHGQHYYLPYGAPTALVVPPTAMMHTNYSWGVSRNTMTPTYHQFGAAASSAGGGGFYATPIWPSSTQQFGVYPVRSPW